MQRKVECQEKQIKVSQVRGATPESGEIAPEIEKVEVYVLFYDDTTTEGHRNIYTMYLTPEEATIYNVGEVYTLTIE